MSHLHAYTDHILYYIIFNLFLAINSKSILFYSTPIPYDLKHKSINRYLIHNPSRLYLITPSTTRIAFYIKFQII